MLVVVVVVVVVVVAGVVVVVGVVVAVAGVVADCLRLDSVFGSKQVFVCCLSTSHAADARPCLSHAS